jgi:hypothetical protein
MSHLYGKVNIAAPQDAANWADVQRFRPIMVGPSRMSHRVKSLISRTSGNGGLGTLDRTLGSCMKGDDAMKRCDM